MSNMCCARVVEGWFTAVVVVAATALRIYKETYWKDFQLGLSPLRKYMKDFTSLSVANLVIGSRASRHQLHH